MTKAELIQQIVESFPEKDLDPKELDNNYTVDALHVLQKDLAKEKEDVTAKVKGEAELKAKKEEEKAKQEAEEKAKAAEASKKVIKKYRLKDPKTQYAEGSFMLAGNQEKEIPEHPSQQLLKRIKAGFIVEVK